MKKILLISIILLSLLKVSQAKTYYNTIDTTILLDSNPKKKYTKTNKKYKGYIVYKGSRGGLFILRTSKKTGKEYKYYVTKKLKK